MNDVEMLSKEEIYTYHVLDEGYMGDMLTASASKAFEEVSSKYDKIKEIYLSLYGKNERTPEEEQLYEKCFSNLVLEASMSIWNSKDHALIEQYGVILQEPNLDPMQIVLMEALKSVIERKGLDIPKNGKAF